MKDEELETSYRPNQSAREATEAPLVTDFTGYRDEPSSFFNSSATKPLFEEDFRLSQQTMKVLPESPEVQPALTKSYSLERKMTNMLKEIEDSQEDAEREETCV